MQINQNRINSILDSLSMFTDTPEQGVTRFSYGVQDKKVREYLTSLCNEIGLSVRTDAVGNIFARLEGRNPSLPVVMTGSHIDSVKNGGKYDGIVGCVCSLEALRVMTENSYTPFRSIEVVFFAEEEASNFKISLFGSKALIGKIDVCDMKSLKTLQGATAIDLISAAGFHPEDMQKYVLSKGDVKSFLELHIEQSVRLDVEGYSVGIVSGIAGLKWIEITIDGKANHSGATPMNLRQDALLTASIIISQINKMTQDANQTTVATVGKIEVYPNFPNIIPEQVRFIVDIRDIEQSGIDYVEQMLTETVKSATTEYGTSYRIELLSTIPPVKLSSNVINVLESNAKKLEIGYIIMPSGAVHDCGSMAEICDAGMIFIPSIGGHSHNADENTAIEDIKLGADLLLSALLELSNE